MAKATTIKVKLVSSADTGFYYVTKKNSRTQTDKLVKKKYDPVAKQARRVPRSQDQVGERHQRKVAWAPRRRPLHFRRPVSAGEMQLRAKVAGREQCHEEATRTAPEPAEPHGPRRCGGPEHSVGLSKALGRKPIAWFSLAYTAGQ